MYTLKPKEYLRLYLKKKLRKENRLAEMERIEKEMSSSGIKYDGLPRKGEISHPTEDAALTLAEIRWKYETEIRECNRIMDDIKDTLSQVEPMSERLLTLRYCEGKEWREISKEIYYSEAYCKKELLNKALDEVQVVLIKKRLKDDGARDIHGADGGDHTSSR